jgi:hypothetical protein
MELAKYERLLNQPRNWGAKTFNNLKERYGAHDEIKRIPLAPKKLVRRALVDNPIISGPLDGSKVLQELSESEQCDFFCRYPKCQHLILRDWDFISDNVLRAISITMGDSLVEIDLSGSMVDVNHFEILLGRVQKLRILRISGCPRVNGYCMRILAFTSHKTLQELHADNCQLFKLDPLLWLAGCVGVNSQKLNRIISLNLARCPLEDRALIGISTGLFHIKYLNLERCEDISDVGVCPLIKSSKALEVINLAECTLLTSKSVSAIGKYCKNMVSCNLNRCFRVTDIGVKTVAKNCHKLQALNVAGIKTVSEDTLCVLALNCPGILILNATGCEDITPNGMTALISGLPYVEHAKTYFGFKPIDEHVDKRLSAQLAMNREFAAGIITHNFHRIIEKCQIKHEYEIERIDKAVRMIQRCLKSYMYRIKFYYIYLNRLKNVQ